MSDPTEMVELARRWLACFETKDVEALVKLYAEDASHYSPRLRLKRPETGGFIRGRAAMRDWWADAFRRIPGLRYQETRITAQPGRVVLEYVRHAPGEPDEQVAEVFEVAGGQIVESRVYQG